MHFNVMSWIRLVILSFEQASHILFIWFIQELDYKVNYAALTVLKVTSKSLTLKTWSSLFVAYASDLEDKNHKST